MTLLQSIYSHSQFGRLATLVLLIAVIWLILLIVRRWLSHRIENPSLKYRSRKMITAGGYILMLFVSAAVYSDKLAGFAVAVGVAGAGIAFALQEVIASAAGWLAIAFGGFYSVGDRVQLGGIKGDVIDIGVLRTTLMETGQWVDGDLYNGRIVRIANSFVFKEPVFNYSADFPFLWDEIKLPVKYGSDYDEARALLLKAANEIVGEPSVAAKKHWKQMRDKFMIEDARIEPMATMVANDNWVEFTLRYTVDFKQRRKAKDELFTKILAQVERKNSKVALASATHEIVGLPELLVKLRQPKKG